jgi:hypothetical protein
MDDMSDASHPMEESSVSNTQQQPMSFRTAWQSDMIDSYLDPQSKQCWKCGHCGNDWSGWSHTKALKHLCGVAGGDSKPCSAHMLPVYRDGYLTLYQGKVNASKDISARDEITNISLDKKDDASMVNYSCTRMN